MIDVTPAMEPSPEIVAAVEFAANVIELGEKSLSQVPETQWIPKEEGNHIINMSAKFSYSMGDRNSIMRGSASAYGVIKVYPKSN